MNLGNLLTTPLIYAIKNFLVELFYHCLPIDSLIQTLNEPRKRGQPPLIAPTSCVVYY
jgi:hypothetical protein